MGGVRVPLLLAAVTALLGAVVAAAPATPGKPFGQASKLRAAKLRHMVVFRSGKARVRRVRARAVRVRVGRKRCTVGTNTPLAALVRSKPGRIRLRDFGSCSRSARDAGGLFVRQIGPDRNRGGSGWVYKVGRKAPPVGAGDPSGPRLKSGQQVVWFYCRVATDCQRTLALKARVEPRGVVSVAVRGYDDAGKGVPVASAAVSTRGASATTGRDGRARLRLASGRYVLKARKAGMIRSFGERVEVG